MAQKDDSSLLLLFYFSSFSYLVDLSATRLSLATRKSGQFTMSAKQYKSSTWRGDVGLLHLKKILLRFYLV